MIGFCFYPVHLKMKAALQDFNVDGRPHPNFQSCAFIPLLQFFKDVVVESLMLAVYEHFIIIFLIVATADDAAALCELIRRQLKLVNFS